MPSYMDEAAKAVVRASAGQRNWGLMDVAQPQEEVTQAEKRVVAAAELLVAAAAGHPSRPSARRSYWKSLEIALGELHLSEHLSKPASQEVEH